MALNIGRAFTRPLDDPNWVVKVIIGTIAGFIPIINLVVGGYAIIDLKNLLERRDRELPEWGDIGGLVMKALMVFIISFVYAVIPITLLVISLVPLVIGASQGSNTGAAAGGIVTLILALLGTLLLFVVIIVLPVGLALYAREDSLGAAFNIFEIFGIVMGNLVDFIIYLLLMIGLGLVNSMIMGAGTFYLVLVSNALIAQIVDKRNYS